MNYTSIDIKDAEKRVVYETIKNQDYFINIISKIANSLIDSFSGIFNFEDKEKANILFNFIKETSLKLLRDLTVDVIKNEKSLYDSIEENIAKSIIDEEFKKAKKKRSK